MVGTPAFSRAGLMHRHATRFSSYMIRIDIV